MISVFGVEFKNLRALLSALGYAGSMSNQSIKASYGSIEQMIAKRLNLADSKEIASKLQELKLRHTNTISINADAFAVLRIMYQQLDSIQRDAIINTYASIKSLDSDELKAKIDDAML